MEKVIDPVQELNRIGTLIEPDWRPRRQGALASIANQAESKSCR